MPRMARSARARASATVRWMRWVTARMIQPRRGGINMAEYVPSPRQGVRHQVELYEGSGVTQGTTLRDTAQPDIIVTDRRNTTGAERNTHNIKVPDGTFHAAVG